MTPVVHVGSRSRFVTATAWVFIVLGLLAAASALARHASLAALAGQILRAGLPWPRPLPTDGLLAARPAAVLAAGPLSVVLLAAAIGLLLRLEWARRGFIVLLGLAIVANLLGLWLQQAVMRSLVDATLQQAVLSPQVAGVFDGLVVAARSMAALLTLGGCGLLGWIGWRLSSAPIRQEFA